MSVLVGALIVLWSALAGAEPVPCPSHAPPVVLDPAYEHDKWVTLPVDIGREFCAFTVSFDGDDDDDDDGAGDRWGVPEWVAYEIKRLDPSRKVDVERPRTWYTDEALHEAGIAPDDDSYKNSGWSRGHMCMLDHAKRLGVDPACNTHTVLNACPQDQAFNAGLWLNLEMLTANWADAYERVWIVCGPVFYDRRPTHWMGGEGPNGSVAPDEMKVAVPDAFYKIVVKQSADPGRPDVLAFLYPHNHPAVEYKQRSEDVDQRPFLTSVDRIEQVTGLDFLTVLDDPIEEDLETHTATGLWPR